MTVFRYHVTDENPAHTRVSLYTGPDDEHLALSGDLCFRSDEFRAFANAITEYNERNEPAEVAGIRCPTCESPDPRWHPATQHEGEVAVICRDAFHAGRGETS